MTKSKVFIVFFTVFVSHAIKADIDVHQFSNDDNLTMYQALTKELRCPKCQNQDIRDSNAPIAQDMRKEVHRLVEEGASYNQVIEFMVERFGDFVTYKPKVSKETYVLWFGPFIMVLIGLFTILMVVRKKKASLFSVSDHVSSETQEILSTDKVSEVKSILDKYDETPREGR